MTIEQGMADIVINNFGCRFRENHYSGRWRRLADEFLVFKDPYKQSGKIIERKLVHRIDSAHIADGKIEDSASLGYGQVVKPSIIDSLRFLLADVYTYLYVLGGLF